LCVEVLCTGVELWMICVLYMILIGISLCVEVLCTGCFGLCVLGVEDLCIICVLRFCVTLVSGFGLKMSMEL
jgi:hypothetical protein